MADRSIDLEKLEAALRHAYPSWDSLDRLLYIKLRWSLEDIVGRVGLKTAVKELLKETESRNTTARLLDEAYRENSTNPLLRSCYDAYFSLSGSTEALERIVRSQNDFENYAEWVKRQQEILSRVCRIDIDGKAGGTGFLVGKSAVLTNMHVVADASGNLFAPERISCRFDYTTADAAGTICGLGQQGIVASSPWSTQDLVTDPQHDPHAEELDYALLHLERLLGETRGRIALSPSPFAFPATAPFFIVQHPEGRPLQLAQDLSAELKVNGNRTRVRYSTNTLPGSSGSPCFNARWELVALHHAGDPKPHHQGEQFGRYNEGIPIDRIHAQLNAQGKLSYLS